MNIKIEFLLTHESDVYEVSRVPCVGELVYNVDDEGSNEVKDVIHVLNADPSNQCVAIIRVK